MPTLTVTSGPAAGQVLDVTGEVVIGRGEVDLVIEDPELSRRHAVVRPADRGVSVEDLGSRNGTWVDGRRISGTVLMSETGTLRVGTTEINVDVAPPDATQVRPTPSPPAAAGGDTLQRPRPRLPDAAGAAAAGGAAAPPPAAPPPAAPPAAAPPAPPSAEAPPGPGGGPGRGKPPLRARLPMLIAVLIVAAIVVALVLAQTGGSAEERALDARLTLGTVTQQNTSALLAGVQTGPPTGTGTATVDEIFQQPQGNRAPVSGKLVSRFDNGSITSILTLKATVQADRSTRFVGKGKVSEGTGDYDGASGSFTYSARQARGANRVTATLKGTLKY